MLEEILAIIMSFLSTKHGINYINTCKIWQSITIQSKALYSFRDKCLDKLLRIRKPPIHAPNHWNQYPIINDSQIKWLLCNQLKFLELRHCAYITDITLINLSQQCPLLEKLEIYRGMNDFRITFHNELKMLTTTGVLSLLEGCPLIHTLILSWCGSVSGNAICQAIANGPHRDIMRHLNLNGVGISNSGIEALSHCCNLETYLNRDCCAEDISPLSNCQKLKVLHLCRGQVSSKSLLTAVKGFHNSITHICVAGNHTLEEADVLEIIRICPTLEII